MFLLMLPPLPSTHSCFPEVDLPPSFFPGQRWLSETEPELGLGLVTEVDGRQVVVLYPASQETRRYLSSSAPLRRVKFREGDELQTPTGDSFVIHSITQEQGVITYHGEGFSLVETQLAGDISNDSPEERLRIGHVDTAQSFSLRKDLWAFRQRWARSPARGLMGPRIQLLPHQLYIAHQVINRQRPRVLLADEPGLGKTIESGLILHHSLLTGRVRRVLVLVPESLLHQWFVEFLRRFQLVFRIVDDSHCNAVEKNDSSANPFEDDAFILCSLSWLTKHPLRMAQVVKAQWDMLVVDEAHHISEESPSAALLTELSLKVPGVLLLTATPEQLGARSHFARLKILDPERYQNFDEYERKHDHYQALADIAAKLLDTAKPFGLTASERTYWDHHDSALLTLLDKTQGTDEAARSRCVTDLLDRFGPGRVIFRNTRQAIAGFPTREVNLYPLPLNKGPGIEAAMDATQIHPKDPRLEWLLGWLNKNPEQKALCICTSRSMVESIESFVRGISHVPLAVFHEGLSLIQRDRNAAWFSEPDGARLLVCSEIGGEGRNFQVAQHLILFDLPDDPELLEQRIGRLDRIGQAPRIFLHVPYVSGTHQEVLARWFHCGMDILRRSRPGGSLVQEAFLDRLKSMESRPFNEEEVAKLVRDTGEFQDTLQKLQEAGRNRLLEWGSFNHASVEELIGAITAEEKNGDLWDLIHRLFDSLGVEVDCLTLDYWHLKPGPRLHPAFPWLKGTDRLASFDREKAMQRDTTIFLSPDHPMVSESMDLWLSSQQGNTSLVGKSAATPEIRMSCIFLLEAIAHGSLRVDRFLPPSPLGITVNHENRIVHEAGSTTDWQDVPPLILEQRPQLVEQLVPALLKTARILVESRSKTIREQALENATEHYRQETERLAHLVRVNPDLGDEEVTAMADEGRAVCKAIASSRLRLDSVQLQLLGML